MSLPQASMYTDGACEPNPGPGGWAAIIRLADREQALSGHASHTTNNRMELLAAISGLEALRRSHQVHLYTDSQYLHLGITTWLPAWVARGWRRKGGLPVLNSDLWKRLHAATQNHDVHWHWLRGHSGIESNEQADKLARQAMRRAQVRRSPANAARP